MIPGDRDASLYLDDRLGGKRWVHGDPRDLMRVPDEIRDCVCFVEARWSDAPSEDGMGTAFFVGMNLGLSDVKDKAVAYAVTAKHNIFTEKAGLADEIVLYLNTHAGGAEAIHTTPANWTPHPFADVAILGIHPYPDVFKFKAIPTYAVATSEWIEEKQIGPGDDAFVTGLLVYHPGRTQIMPIVRVGNVAALPKDPVRVDTGEGKVEDVVALLEVRSIGGLSGSPVFVHLPFWRDTKPGDLFIGQGGTAGSGGKHLLLGVMHGFYPVGENDPEGVSGDDENLNTGIGVVTLADRMMDLINDPRHVKVREQMKKHEEEKQMPKPARARTDEQTSDYERFEDLARKIVQVPKKDLDKKRKEGS